MGRRTVRQVVMQRARILQVRCGWGLRTQLSV